MFRDNIETLTHILKNLILRKKDASQLFLFKRNLRDKPMEIGIELDRVCLTIEEGTEGYQAFDNPFGYDIFNYQDNLISILEKIIKPYKDFAIEVCLVVPEEKDHKEIKVWIQSWIDSTAAHVKGIQIISPEKALKNNWASEDRKYRTNKTACGIILNYKDVTFFEIIRGQISIEKKLILKNYGLDNLLDRMGILEVIGDPEKDETLYLAQDILNDLYEQINRKKLPESALKRELPKFIEEIDSQFKSFSSNYKKGDRPLLLGGLGGGLLRDFIEVKYTGEVWPNTKKPTCLVQDSFDFSVNKKTDNDKKHTRKKQKVTIILDDSIVYKAVKNQPVRKRSAFIETALKYYLANN